MPHLEQALHLPTTDHRYNRCDGQPWQTRLLATDEFEAHAYPMCPACWDSIRGGDQVPEIPDTAIRPKELTDDPTPAQRIRATATRLDLPAPDR